MSDQNAETADGLGLAEAIALLRDDLLRARAAGAAWGRADGHSDEVC